MALRCHLYQYTDRLHRCRIDELLKDDEANNGQDIDPSSPDLPQMKCMSCCQSCRRVLPIRVPNVQTVIRLSGGRRWKGSSRVAFATSSLHCSTRVPLLTYSTTDRLEMQTGYSLIIPKKTFCPCRHITFRMEHNNNVPYFFSFLCNIWQCNHKHNTFFVSFFFFGAAQK